MGKTITQWLARVLTLALVYLYAKLDAAGGQEAAAAGAEQIAAGVAAVATFLLDALLTKLKSGDTLAAELWAAIVPGGASRKLPLLALIVLPIAMLAGCQGLSGSGRLYDVTYDPATGQFKGRVEVNGTDAEVQGLELSASQADGLKLSVNRLSQQDQLAYLQAQLLQQQMTLTAATTQSMIQALAAVLGSQLPPQPPLPSPPPVQPRPASPVAPAAPPSPQGSPASQPDETAAADPQLPSVAWARPLTVIGEP